MQKPASGRLQSVVLLSRWLVAPFIVGMVGCLGLLIFRFFADLYELVIQALHLGWHDLVVNELNLIDITLTANLVLIVIFATYQNYIQKIDRADYENWPDGVAQVDFSMLKQKLLGSITGIAAVDALAWYFDLDKTADTAKLGWAIAFPLMFVAAMLMLAAADWLTIRAKK